jgi:hypothetical protein
VPYPASLLSLRLSAGRHFADHPKTFFPELSLASVGNPGRPGAAGSLSETLATTQAQSVTVTVTVDLTLAV